MPYDNIYTRKSENLTYSRPSYGSLGSSRYSSNSTSYPSSTPSWERSSSLLSTSMDSKYSRPTYSSLNSTNSSYTAPSSSSYRSSYSRPETSENKPAYSSSTLNTPSSYRSSSRFDRPDTTESKPSYSSSTLSTPNTSSYRSSYVRPESRAENTDLSTPTASSYRSSYVRPESRAENKLDNNDFSKTFDRFERKSWRQSFPPENNKTNENESKFSYSRNNSNQSNSEIPKTSRMTDLKSDDKMLEEKNSINSLERRNSKKFDFDVDILKQKRADRTLDITDRIERTLTKHKVSDPKEPVIRERNSQIKEIDTSKCKFLQERGTSPNKDSTTDNSSSSRISRDSEKYMVRSTKYVFNEQKDKQVQTEEYYLKDRTKEVDDVFDYFDHVKKSMNYAPKYQDNNSSYDSYKDKLNQYKSDKSETDSKNSYTNIYKNNDSKDIKNGEVKSVNKNLDAIDVNKADLKPFGSIPVNKSETDSKSNYYNSYKNKDSIKDVTKKETDTKNSYNNGYKSNNGNKLETDPKNSYSNNYLQIGKKEETKIKPVNNIGMASKTADDIDSYQNKKQEGNISKLVTLDTTEPKNIYRKNGIQEEHKIKPVSKLETENGYRTGVYEPKIKEVTKNGVQDDYTPKATLYSENDDDDNPFVGESMNIDDLLSKALQLSESANKMMKETKAAESETKTSDHMVSSAILDDQPWWKSDTKDEEHEKSQIVQKPEEDDPEEESIEESSKTIETNGLSLNDTYEYDVEENNEIKTIDESSKDNETAEDEKEEDLEEKEEDLEEKEEDIDEKEEDKEEKEEDIEEKEEDLEEKDDDENEEDWEYYDESEEEEKVDSKDGQNIDESVSQNITEEQQMETAKEKRDRDKKENWIKKCINSIIPNLPSTKSEKNGETTESESIHEEECQINFDDPKIAESMYSEHHGYRDWLKDASVEINNDLMLWNIDQTINEDEEYTKSDDETDNEMKSKAIQIIKKLYDEDDVNLKKVLFSLKNLFQSETGLVYEFIKEKGLIRLINIGDNTNEPQLKNFVLRALGQLMLYVDGMKGVMETIEAIELLYKLVDSENKLVVKTAIKLLLVFIDYDESNYKILIQAIKNVSFERDELSWSYLTKILETHEGNLETELCTFAFTLINKTLYEIDDQETFYDQTDYLEELNIDDITSLSDSDSVSNSLLEEIQLYNVALKQEDGDSVTEEDISALYQDSSLRLRTSLRSKITGSTPRKSLRYKIRLLKNAEIDDNGDIEEIKLDDVKKILLRNGIKPSESGEALDNLDEEEASDFVLKAKDVYYAKKNKIETENLELEKKLKEVDEQEGFFQWEKIKTNIDRPLLICDLDFSDLKTEEDTLEIKDEKIEKSTESIPVPPPAPPPAFKQTNSLEPGQIPAPPPFPNLADHTAYRKTKKTIKLFWKELPQSSTLDTTSTVWENLKPITVDYNVLEFLFESRAKEIVLKESNKIQTGPMKEIVVLDNRRSNFINIGMTKLPPPRIIKDSVLKMDSSIINKEGIEKLLTMLPSEEEISKIEEARENYPELPLGTAEQFLVTLSSISELQARLRLWVFKMDFVILEKEICEPLGDLKQSIDILSANITFNAVLSVILEIGNFLNGGKAKGFEIEYLAKIPEIKDTIHKHSMLYHLTFWLLESFSDVTDLYSEIGPVTRASKVDFDDLSNTLERLEEECKCAWDYLKIITKFDVMQNNDDSSKNSKVSDFLTDAAERILVMQTIFKLLKQKFRKFLLWLGIPKSFIHDYKINNVFKIISEFALEFRTSRERAIQVLRFKREAKERNKSRAKLHELAKNSSKNDLNVLLGGERETRKKKKHRRHREKPKEGKEEHNKEYKDLKRVKVQIRPPTNNQDDVDHSSLAPSADLLTNPEVRRRKKKMHRNVTVQLNEDQSITDQQSNESLLLQSLMDMSTTKIRRNGERRKSSKKRSVEHNIEELTDL